MDYQIRKVGRSNKVGIPKDNESQDFVWYKESELKEFSDSILHIGNTTRFLDGHEYQVALALSPVTRKEIPESDIRAIRVIKTNYKDSRPADRKCNYLALTSQKGWEFSVIKGLTYLFRGETALHKKRIDRAFRYTIEDQIKAFKSKNWDDFCRQNGYKKWHVDHIHPMTFEKLVKDFLLIYQIDFESIKTHTDLATGSDTFSDPLILSQWQEYHRDNAKLRFDDPVENSRRGNRAF